jgi:uncharacterized protein YneF (UPF0154 family)
MNVMLWCILAGSICLVFGAVFGAFWGRKHPKIVSIAAAAADEAKKKL